MTLKTADRFLPISKDDLRQRGWSQLDVVLITGDAYVDHPSYGAAVIGRYLLSHGFTVGVIAQPNWRSLDDFLKLGRPKLFVGITAGNVDSMIANYTANKRVRSIDDYSPGGKPGLRPDRAVIVYANRAREAFGPIPIVLGGIEASLRRLAHYDYWDDHVRRSVLIDSKADILVYGMGERQTLEIAQRLGKGENVHTFNDIQGTVINRNDHRFIDSAILLPSFEEVKADKQKFNQAFRQFHSCLNPYSSKPLVQPHADRFIIQLPPALPLGRATLDKIYELDYARDWHPGYKKEGGVKGFETVRFSIISHRGCCGECSFCSLYAHQGRIIQSRSQESILREAQEIAKQKDFKGTITDIGGPTANLYEAVCSLWERQGACSNKSCLAPEKCKNLALGYKRTIELYRKIRCLPKVKHVFVGSGFRYDLLADAAGEEYLKELCSFHVSGRMKVAPEHNAASVLKVMNKTNFELYKKFVEKFTTINKKLGKKQFLVNYFISAHPGSTLKDALGLALYLAKMNMLPEQIQDFIPLPMTLSGCVYHTERDPFTGEKIYSAKTFRERKLQRALLQHRNPVNKKLVIEALRSLDQVSLIPKFFPK